MAVGVFAVLQFLPHPDAGTAGAVHASSGDFTGFLVSFMALFAFAGIGNGSTFRMIPVIFLTERQRAAQGLGPAAQEQAVKDANKEAAAVLGFSSAIGAYGGFFIPKSYGTAIAMTGSPDAGPVCLHRLLRHLHRDDLVVLQPQERTHALLNAPATTEPELTP